MTNLAASAGEPAIRPSFLRLPNRSSKPRRSGVTHLLDKGLSVAEVENQLDVAAPHIDIWKFGWGTAYLDPGLARKLAVLQEGNVLACTGGTLLELAWQQGKVAAFLDWAERSGFPCIEVSCGLVEMARTTKAELIEGAAERFTVLAEIGSKDEAVRVSADVWATAARDDVSAGATWVVTEGRESGTVGLFDPDGTVRTPVVDAVVDAVGLDRALFEAPRKDQQAWLIRTLGPGVNLGNIAAGDALAVETLRLGLRSDTAIVGDVRGVSEEEISS